MGSTATEVESGMSLCTEITAVREKDLGFFLKERCRMGNGSLLKVQPRQVGGLNIWDSDGSYFLATKSGDKIAIATKIRDELQSPRLPKAVGSLCRVVTKAVNFSKRVALGCKKTLLEFLVWDDRVGVSHSCDIEGFAWR